MEDPVTVTAYFSENMPPNLDRVRSELLNFLEEFRVYSDHNLEYVFVNPNEDQATEQEAQQAGATPDFPYVFSLEKEQWDENVLKSRRELLNEDR